MLRVGALSKSRLLQSRQGPGRQWEGASSHWMGQWLCACGASGRSQPAPEQTGDLHRSQLCWQGSHDRHFQWFKPRRSHLRYFLMGSQATSRITMEGSSSLRALMAEM